MGRVFGLIIVSIGLWLVVSLPTRDAAAPSASPSTTPSTTAAATPVTTDVNSVGAIQAGSATTAFYSGRTNRTLDERTHAARGREIESEPDPRMQRSADPMPAAVPSRSLVVPNSATASSPPPVVAVAVAHGSARFPETTTDRSIPAPTPIVPPALPSDAGVGVAAAPSAPSAPSANVVRSVPSRTRTAQVTSPGAAQSIPVGEAATQAQPSLGTGSPLAPSARATPGAAVKPPRIFDVVRRDLAAQAGTVSAAKDEARAISGQPAMTGALGTKSAAADARMAALKPSSASSPSAKIRVAVDTQDEGGAKKDVARIVAGRPAANASEAFDNAPTARTAVKSPRTVTVIRGGAPRPPAPPIVRPVPAAVRVAHAYPPPAYVGKLAIRSAPPTYFIQAGAPNRRPAFRSDSLWNSISRTGM